MTSNDALGSDDPEPLCTLVRRARASRGLTQEGLARQLGVSFATVNGWERGRQRPDEEQVLRLREMAAAAPDVPLSTVAPMAPALTPAAGPTDAAAEPLDGTALSGWPVEKRDRRDFYHRPREFPLVVLRWRAALVERIRGDRASFPRAAAAVRVALAEARGDQEGGLTKEVVEQRTSEALRTVVDEYIAAVREVARLLAILYPRPEGATETGTGSPDAGEEPVGAPVDEAVSRVLARLDLLRELGLQRREPEAAVDLGLIPPNLRRALHLNLVAHGAAVCLPEAPRCGRCEVRYFCGHHRHAEVARIDALGRPRIVDLFAGAGGLSEGFEQTGFAPSLVLDADAVAMKTYRLNHTGVAEDRILVRDIRTLTPGEVRQRVGDQRIAVLIGAPPCQGFSHVGHRSKSSLTGYDVTEDQRNYLYRFMMDVAAELKPRLVLMENVPGMKTARKEGLSFLDAAARMLEAEGFTTAQWRLNAAAYGVPQERLRYFLVAAAPGERLPVLPPEPYQDSTARDFDTEALPPITFDEAVLGLPPLAADEGEVAAHKSSASAALGPRARRYLQKFRILSDSRLLFNHTVRYHNPRDLELYALLRPGEDSVHALERHGRGDLMRYRADIFDDKYARLRGDRPCKTIVAHLAKDGNGYIHPTQTRSISFREAARVQSFRDDYIFCGSPSDQWVHLGNAVPPVLAAAIARSFLAALGEEKKA